MVKEKVCVCTSVHTRDPRLPAPAVLSSSRAWWGQTPSGPPRRALPPAPLPLWHPDCPHADETVPDASLHHTSLASVPLMFGMKSWRCERSEEEVSSVGHKRRESSVRVWLGKHSQASDINSLRLKTNLLREKYKLMYLNKFVLCSN